MYFFNIKGNFIYSCKVLAAIKLNYINYNLGQTINSINLISYTKHIYFNTQKINIIVRIWGHTGFCAFNKHN